jgi:hypothetical protein
MRLYKKMGQPVLAEEKDDDEDKNEREENERDV